MKICLNKETKFQSHGSGFRVKDTITKMWNLSLHLREAAETRHIPVVSPYGGPEKTLHETLKVNHSLCCRPQAIGNLRIG